MSGGRSLPRLDENGRPHWTYVVWCLFWGVAFLIGAGLAVKWAKANLGYWTQIGACAAVMVSCLLIGLWIDSRDRSRGRGEGPGA